MGFWNWLTGRGEKIPKRPEGGALPEMVLLLSEPMVVEASFIQGAVKHALGVFLSVGERDATEFVAGAWPFFFFQFGGRLMQIKLPAKPYFSAVSRPFVSGDPDALLQTAREKGLGDEVAAHQGWIAVTYMNPPPPDGEDPFWYVAKVLGSLSYANVLAIIHPVRGIISGWEEGMMETLEEGEYESIFGA